MHVTLHFTFKCTVDFFPWDLYMVLLNAQQNIPISIKYNLAFQELIPSTLDLIMME